MKLYHFTRREYLSSILQNGIDSGEIPLTLTESVRGISLTEIDSPTVQIQKWTALVPPKLDYRLTVEIESSDKLIRWKYVPQKLKMEISYWHVLTKSGNADPYKWWVFFGVIPPERIRGIYSREEKRFMTEMELEKIKTEPMVRGCYGMETTWTPYEDALRSADLRSA